MTILFVCQANVGRSQMAEAFFNSNSKDNLAISAGIDDLVDKYKARPSIEVQKLMKEKNIDISKQTVKQLTQTHLDQSDWVVVLCKREQYIKNKYKHKHVFFRFSDDPFNLSLTRQRQIRDQIEILVKELIDLINKEKL